MTRALNRHVDQFVFIFVKLLDSKHAYERV